MKFDQILICNVGLLIGVNCAEALEPKSSYPAERVVPMQLRQSLVGECLGQYPVLAEMGMRSAAIVFQ